MATQKIEPFRVEVPVEVLADLRARLSSTRFPDEVPDTGWEYGTNLAYLKELVEYWRTRYDWRAQQLEINRFAQFKAKVDGLGIHFIHEKGKRARIPSRYCCCTDGRGSIYEFMELIPMLTDPAAHGGDAKGLVHRCRAIAAGLRIFGSSARSCDEYPGDGRSVFTS